MRILPVIIIAFFVSCSTLEKAVVIPAPESQVMFDFESDVMPEVDSCYDLTIKSVKVLEKNKKKIILEYTIKNKGTLPVPLEGASRSKKDNVGIHIFFSGDDKYNRGDLFIDGFFIDLPSNVESKVIQPGETYKAQLSISTKRKTSYHSSIIFHIDPIQMFRECDETNNYSFVRM
ncbi:MAG: hypothetical protein AB8G11_19895 [Saprospiraceae bacterium]